MAPLVLERFPNDLPVLQPHFLPLVLPVKAFSKHWATDPTHAEPWVFVVFSYPVRQQPNRRAMPLCPAIRTRQDIEAAVTVCLLERRRSRSPLPSRTSRVTHVDHLSAFNDRRQNRPHSRSECRHRLTWLTYNLKDRLYLA